jgi:hypothetical protein
VHVGFASDRVACIRYGGRGKSRVVEKALVRCEASPAPRAWQPALVELGGWLQSAAVMRSSASVALSDSLVRYTLVPANEQLSTPAEELAYARHCFELVHGRAVDAWDVRLSPGRRGEERVASAVDRELLDGLRRVFTHARVRLDSIQPLLMAAFNRGRRYVDGAPALFMTAEGEHYTCAGFMQGHWKSVRSGTLAGLRGELGAVLEREWLWLGSADRPDVTLFYAGDEEPDLVLDDGWTVSALTVQPPAGFSAAEERSFALALGIS